MSRKGVENCARFKQNLVILCRNFRKNKIVDDKIILDSLFKPATLEEIEDNQVIITTELKWNIDAILEKRAEIESILSNSFSKPIKIKVLEVEEYKKSKQKRFLKSIVIFILI